MLKRPIKYTDYNDQEVTEDFYFNLSKPELIELEVEFEKGLSKLIEDIVRAENKKELIKLFKRVVLTAYGKKSEDGKRFVKSDEMREQFSQHAAYESLFIELATNDGAAVTFLKGIMPRDMVEGVDTTLAAVPTLPTPPTPPTPPAPPTS